MEKMKDIAGQETTGLGNIASCLMILLFCCSWFLLFNPHFFEGGREPEFDFHEYNKNYALLRAAQITSISCGEVDMLGVSKCKIAFEYIDEEYETSFTYKASGAFIPEIEFEEGEHLYEVSTLRDLEVTKSKKLLPELATANNKAAFRNELNNVVGWSCESVWKYLGK